LLIAIPEPNINPVVPKARNLEMKELNNQKRRIRKWKQRGSERIDNKTIMKQRIQQLTTV